MSAAALVRPTTSRGSLNSSKIFSYELDSTRGTTSSGSVAGYA